MKENRKKGIRIILVSHGNLAQSVLENVEMLMGPQKDLAAYGLARNEKMEEPGAGDAHGADDGVRVSGGGDDTGRGAADRHPCADGDGR